MPLVLIVEDRRQEQSPLQFHSHRAGFDVVVANTGEQFVRLVDEHLPDAFVIDWTRDAALANELLMYIRSDDLTRETPAVHLVPNLVAHHRAHPDFDAEIVTPVSGEEVIQKVAALIEIVEAQQEPILENGGIRIDVRRGTVEVAGQNLNLGATEIKLLTVLLRNPDRAFNRSQLLDRVWGRANDIEERTVDVHVSRIRKRLSPYGLHYQIQTARGVGYRFVPD